MMMAGSEHMTIIRMKTFFHPLSLSSAGGRGGSTIPSVAGRRHSGDEGRRRQLSSNVSFVFVFETASFSVPFEPA